MAVKLAEDCGYKVIGYLDEDNQKINTYVMGVKVVGKISDYKDEEIRGKNFIVAIGNNKIRCDIMTRINNANGITPTLIHPTAKVSKSAKIGKGVYIQPGAVIWTKVIIEDFVIISPNTVIAHHTVLKKACMISTMCVVGACIEIGEYSFLGIGSIAITGINRVGKNVYLGAGTTVIKDTEDNVLLVGSPARKLRNREPIK